MAAKKADPKAQQKKPAQKDKAKSKAAGKKWNTSQAVKDKIQKNVIINESLFDKIKKEVIGMTTVTPGNIATKHNLTVSLSKRILAEIALTGEIEKIASSSFGVVYGKTVAPVPVSEVATPEAEKATA
ncbi:small subunit ribosomal protein S25e [Nematocida sp. AWRm77]|nr:small subunit ribosomal protein S25e [Nematocida sp. AWRm77]